MLWNVSYVRFISGVVIDQKNMLISFKRYFSGSIALNFSDICPRQNWKGKVGKVTFYYPL